MNIIVGWRFCYESISTVRFYYYQPNHSVFYSLGATIPKPGSTQSETSEGGDSQQFFQSSANARRGNAWKEEKMEEEVDEEEEEESDFGL